MALVKHWRSLKESTQSDSHSLLVSNRFQKTFSNYRIVFVSLYVNSSLFVMFNSQRSHCDGLQPRHHAGDRHTAVRVFGRVHEMLLTTRSHLRNPLECRSRHLEMSSAVW